MASWLAVLLMTGVMWLSTMPNAQLEDLMSYIDPGAGSIALQMAVGAEAAGGIHRIRREW
jgi:hypothetical protein